MPEPETITSPDPTGKWVPAHDLSGIMSCIKLFREAIPIYYDQMTIVRCRRKIKVDTGRPQFLALWKAKQPIQDVNVAIGFNLNRRTIPTTFQCDGAYCLSVGVLRTDNGPVLTDAQNTAVYGEIKIACKYFLENMPNCKLFLIKDPDLDLDTMSSLGGIYRNARPDLMNAFSAERDDVWPKVVGWEIFPY